MAEDVRFMLKEEAAARVRFVRGRPGLEPSALGERLGDIERRQYADREMGFGVNDGQTRIEEEIEIDERRFRSLWPLTEGRRVQKTRYVIPEAGGLAVELDIYHSSLSGLLTAEIEFDSPQAAGNFDPPAWLGREVTEDPRYKNKRLAVHGMPA